MTNYKTIIALVIILIVLITGFVLGGYFMSRKDNYISGKTLKFIHNPKVAGTSIEDYARTKGILWGKYDKKYKPVKKIPIIEENHDADWHRYPKFLDKKYIKSNDWFVVVRNPYERTVSDYFWTYGLENHKKYIPESERTIEHMNTKIREEILNRPSQFGGHFSEQYKYTKIPARVHILKMEELDKTFPLLMKLYNLDIKLENVKNKGSATNKYSVDDLDSEIIELINKVYDKDFKIFGYKKIIR